MTKTCETCRWWTEPAIWEVDEPPLDPTQPSGWCIRYPWRVLKAADSLCGEHEPRAEPECVMDAETHRVLKRAAADLRGLRHARCVGLLADSYAKDIESHLARYTTEPTE